ncbi:hypothetical protein QAD02_012375 [Eretmocerus hayati]|uniref:Uncharacterized protein n=1 Tax=Eretmocerus hayati TaxID=131215 RepID=A0ACC2P0D8_9HYME|nr:hypothetical protein QAD02_012375 [Eretmocerus hayati]
MTRAPDDERHFQYHVFKNKKRKLDILHERVERVSTSLQVDSVPEISDDRVEAPISQEDGDDQALGAFIDLGCTQRKYEKLRLHTRKKTNDEVYPLYKHIQQAKKRCYPENVYITERKAWVELQDLLNHSCNRILMTIDDSVLAEFRGKQFIFHVKWGLDGASAQQTIKQKWLEAANQIENLLQPLDASIVQVSMVPLRIVTTEGEILWNNPTPNSTSYCRTVQFEFQKETIEYTMSQYEHYEDKIRQLEPFTSEALGPESRITYNLKCTMMDGKTCSALTEQRSSCSCNVCFASPKDMNHLEFVKGLPVNRNSLQFGLHPLHCRIRFMEFLLHLAYNMDFKEFYATTELTRIIKAARKDFGYKFADDIIAEYGWYTLPPSIHKALIHGWEIVESLELSSGALSEEPLECNNKILKRGCLSHSRMCNRKSSNEDVMHYLLVASDPYITSLRETQEKKFQELSSEAKDLLL